MVKTPWVFRPHQASCPLTTPPLRTLLQDGNIGMGHDTSMSILVHNRGSFHPQKRPTSRHTGVRHPAQGHSCTHSQDVNICLWSCHPCAPAGQTPSSARNRQGSTQTTGLTHTCQSHDSETADFHGINSKRCSNSSCLNEGETVVHAREHEPSFSFSEPLKATEEDRLA